MHAEFVFEVDCLVGRAEQTIRIFRYKMRLHVLLFWSPSLQKENVEQGIIVKPYMFTSPAPCVCCFH